ncbi:cellulose binding domain-containing protein [Sphaerisporangium dianthi]|uniref:Cellulose binding domain-containing protein n=1 Tax=Sphaerisporangium dianthi TaxID=1436120 RepID=A0ABV9CBQ0_9ACTN
MQAVPLKTRRRWREALLALTLVASGVTAATLTVAGPASAAAGCRVSYVVANRWPGGFTANVTITNLGDAVTNWRLTWSFTAGETIAYQWNAVYTQSGADVNAVNVSYNGSLATGASTLIGFIANSSGANPMPSSFALNGVRCGGPAVPTPSPSGDPVPPLPTPSRTPTGDPAPPIPTPSRTPTGDPVPPTPSPR